MGQCLLRRAAPQHVDPVMTVQFGLPARLCKVHYLRKAAVRGLRKKNGTVGSFTPTHRPITHGPSKKSQGGLFASGVVTLYDSTGPAESAHSIGKARLGHQLRDHQRWALRVFDDPEAETYTDIIEAASIIAQSGPDNLIHQRATQWMRHHGLAQ